jgi:hypothetical protein
MSVEEFRNRKIKLDARARAVLHALAEHKILSTDQIEILYFGSDRSAQRVGRSVVTACADRS